MTKEEYNSIVESIAIRTLLRLTQMKSEMKFYIYAFALAVFKKVIYLTENPKFVKSGVPVFKLDGITITNLEHICAAYYLGFHSLIHEKYTSDQFDFILEAGGVIFHQPIAYCEMWKELISATYWDEKAKRRQLVRHMTESINPILGAPKDDFISEIIHEGISYDCAVFASEISKDPAFIKGTNEKLKAVVQMEHR